MCSSDLAEAQPDLALALLDLIPKRRILVEPCLKLLPDWRSQTTHLTAAPLGIVTAHRIDVVEDPKNRVADVDEDLVCLPSGLMRPLAAAADLFDGTDRSFLTRQDIEIRLRNVGPDAKGIHIDQDIELARPGRGQQVVAFDLPAGLIPRFQASLPSVAPDTDLPSDHKSNARMFTGTGELLRQTLNRQSS